MKRHVGADDEQDAKRRTMRKVRAEPPPRPRFCSDRPLRIQLTSCSFPAAMER